MGFIGKKELYTILCTGIGDYSSDSLELNVDITPDFVVRNIDKYNFVYKIEVVDGSTLIREFGFPKLESEVVSVITPTWIFEHENNTLKITGSSGSGEGLPDISDANIGDVLTVGENGVEWSSPSGGLPEAPYSSGMYYLNGAVYDDGEDIDIYWENVPMRTVNNIVIDKIKIVLLPFLESGQVRNLRLITCQGTQSELSVTLETAYRPNNNNLSSSVEILGINRTQQKVANMQITNNGLIIITNIDGTTIDASDRFYFTGVY